MQPGQVNSQRFRVIDASGSPVTGLTLASFTVEANTRPAATGTWGTWTHGATVTERSTGYYYLTWTEPPGAGFRSLEILPVSASHTVYPGMWTGEIEGQDLDSIAARVASYSAVLTRGSQLGAQVPITLIAYRYRVLLISIIDNLGDPVDLTTYSTWKVAIRSADQTTVKFDGITGTPTGFSITGDAAGNLTIIFPETLATTGTQADGYNGVPVESRQVARFWEVTADIGGDATKTVSIIRSSPCTVLAREVGT